MGPSELSVCQLVEEVSGVPTFRNRKFVGFGSISRTMYGQY